MQMRSAVVPLVFGAAVVSHCACAVLRVLVVTRLESGPSVAGYALLTVALRASLLAAVLLAGSGVLLVAVRQVRWPIAVLVIACLLAFAVSMTLETLGSGLSGIRPTAQPPELDSLLLAMTGTGAALVPVPWILGIGAIVAIAAAAAGRVRVKRAPRPAG